LKHIHSLPNQPDAIPYVTSYYSRTWGFCLAHRDIGRLVEDEYRVTIDSDLSPGSLTYAEMLIPGASAEEVLLTTYVCHPSMANNELSGPVVMTALGRWLASQENLRYSYRLLFLPETIGAITYLSEHLNELKQNVVAGWVLTCIGDDRTYSFVPSRLGNTLADRVSKAVLTELNADFTEYSYLDRGSDERQWCAPGVDLPVASLMRSKYGTFDEYHTSLDDLGFVTPSGLQGGLDMMSSAIQLLEGNFKYKLETIGEPQLGKRGLRPNLGTKETASLVRNMMNVLIYSDGNHDVLEVSSVVGVPTAEVISISENLAKHGLLSRRG
jgi:aminopeptidase-like protein